MKNIKLKLISVKPQFDYFKKCEKDYITSKEEAFGYDYTILQKSFWFWRKWIACETRIMMITGKHKMTREEKFWIEKDLTGKAYEFKTYTEAFEFNCHEALLRF